MKPFLRQAKPHARTQSAEYERRESVELISACWTLRGTGPSDRRYVAAVDVEHLAGDVA
jgi:hypothetical protein